MSFSQQTIPGPDIVLPYQFSKAKQILVVTFCVVIAAASWTAAWALRHGYSAPPSDNFNAKVIVHILLSFACVYTFFMIPLMMWSCIHLHRFFKKIVLGPTGITLPAKWSGRPIHFPYANIRQIHKKVAVGNPRLHHILGSKGSLQLFHPAGKAVIIIEMLPSPADADLIIQTWTNRR